MSTLILLYILTGIVIILLIWILVTERRLRTLFAGTQAKDLEEVLSALIVHIKELKEGEKEINKHLTVVDKRLDGTIRRVKTVRFNPFEDAGSNQSFAISFLNDEGDGVIISSLYARDRMSIFAKPIEKGVSDFELSEEEKGVLAKSK
ncbi:MAG: DUF4446 family protein [Candidatus Paceibacterota bacterium]